MALKKNNRIVVTGATGFLGSAIVNRLVLEGHQVTTVTRCPQSIPGISDNITLDLLNPILETEKFRGQDLIIHLAGQADGGDPAVDPKKSNNAIMAQNIAVAARAAEVPHVLAMSSMMARVAETAPFQARNYGHEKAEADKILRSGLAPAQQLILLRPPAVYGPGMKGSLASLAKLIRKGVPLPLGLARQPRPYLALENLVDLVAVMSHLNCEAWSLSDRKAMDVSDGTMLSTVDLIQMIGKVLGKPARVFPMPRIILFPLLKLVGKSELVASAFDPLPMADSSAYTNAFGWKPCSQMPTSLGFIALE